MVSALGGLRLIMWHAVERRVSMARALSQQEPIMIMVVFDVGGAASALKVEICASNESSDSIG